MSINAGFTYSENLPNPPDNPSFDVAAMQVNSQSIDSIIAVDHIGFGTSDGGIHTVIRQNGSSIAVDPTNITGYNQVYSKNYTPDTTGGMVDTQLFAETGLGEISQLTGFLATGVLGEDGWQWIGGVLLQWGFTSFPSGDGDHSTHTVTFKDRIPGAIPFPNQIYCVIPGLTVASGSTTTASNTIAIRTSSSTGFQYLYNSSASNGTVLFPGFYWIAIGN